jgi:hypothetical protein
MRNVFAYTAEGALYPEYISVDRREDGNITVTVRGPKVRQVGDKYFVPGQTVAMTLPPEWLRDLTKALANG